MNKRVYQYVLFVLFLSGMVACSECGKQAEPFECVLEGEVKGWPECSSLVLIEAEKREKAVPAVCIPVVDGKFEYTFRDSVNRLYQLYGKYDRGNCSWVCRWKGKNCFHKSVRICLLTRSCNR